MPNTAFKKKLYRPPIVESHVQTQHTRTRTKRVLCDPASIEREFRQQLADKISGNMVGLWLLVPEHQRLGTWDLLCGWTGQPRWRLEPRLGMQLVNEAVICTTGVRQDRSLAQSGFAAVNGLAFIANDTAISDLLAAHTVADAQRLQVALGKLRLASQHFRGRLLAIDPHRVHSYSKRRMRCHRKDNRHSPAKMSQTFWALDAEASEPVCFLSGTASRTVAQATPELLQLAAAVLQPESGQCMAMADSEHFSAKLIDRACEAPFDLLIPMPQQPAIQKPLAQIPPDQFIRRWAGYATFKRPYCMKRTKRPLYQFVQRFGERPEEWKFNAFLSTRDCDELNALTHNFPQRWHVEEFFNANQALGWNRSGTLNLHIRYGQMTMALIAQAAISQLRRRIGEPIANWDAAHMGEHLFGGLDGDVRVHGDTIVVTYYNAPNVERLRHHYENLPAKLEAQGVDPRIPWMFNFELDFRFR